MQAVMGELRAERARQDIPQGTWARQAGLNENSVSNMLAGRRSMDLNQLAALCKVLGVKPSVILERAESLERPVPGPRTR